MMIFMPMISRAMKRILFYFAVIIVLIVSAECPNWCSQHGICTGTKDTDSCICEIGYAGNDCRTRLCPKGFDPLNQGMISRSISLQTGAKRGVLSGQFSFEFNGEKVQLDASAERLNDQICSTLISSLPNVGVAQCIRKNENIWAGATYEIVFHSWPTIPWENNIYKNNGNPPLSSFSCEMSSASISEIGAWCEITDISKSSIKLYEECSNRGICNREKEICDCNFGFNGLACDDITDVNDIAVHSADGPFFSANVLKLRASRSPSSDFNLLHAIAYNSTKMTLSGMGDLNISGNFRGGMAEMQSLLLDYPSDNGSAIDVHVQRKEFSGSAISSNIQSAAAGSFLLNLSSSHAGIQNGLTVSADGTTSRFFGPGGLEIVGQGGLIVEQDILVGGNVHVKQSATVSGTIKSSKLDVQDKMNKSPVAVFSANHPHFDSTVLSLDIQGSGDAAFIRATSLGIEKFVIDALGSVYIRQGGLHVDSGGIKVQSGGLEIESGGIEVHGGITLSSGTFTMANSEGLLISGGPLQVESVDALSPLINAFASNPHFSGSVLQLGASSDEPKSFNFIEGLIDGEKTFEISGSGDFILQGGINVGGNIVADGVMNLKSGMVLHHHTVNAGGTIDLSSYINGGFIIILNDHNILQNFVKFPTKDQAVAGSVLLLHNADTDSTSGDIMIPSGFTVFLIHNGSTWRDLGVLNAAVTELNGIRSFSADGNLDIGKFSFKAGTLIAGGNKEGSIAAYGKGGKLTSLEGLVYDIGSNIVNISKLKINELAGSIDFKGFSAKNIALKNVTLDELPFLKVGQIVLNQGPKGSPEMRFLGLGPDNKIIEFESEHLSMSRKDKITHMRELHVSTAKLGQLVGNLDCNGHSLKNVYLENILGVLSIEDLKVDGKITLNKHSLSENNTVLTVGQNGEISPASGLSASDGMLSIPKLNFTSGPSSKIIMNGGTIIAPSFRGEIPLDGSIIGGIIRPNEVVASRAILGKTTMHGALDLAGMPLLNVRKEDLEGESVRELQELTVLGDLKLANRELQSDRLLILEKDGYVVPAQSERLEVECNFLVANNVTAISLHSEMIVNGMHIESKTIEIKDTLQATRIETNQLVLSGDIHGGGNTLKDIVLENVRALRGLQSLSIDGQLKIENFSNIEGSLVFSNKDGVLLPTSPGMGWNDKTLFLDNLFVQNIAGNVNLNGYTIHNGKFDLSGPSSRIEGLEDLKIERTLKVGSDAFIQGSLSVLGGVIGGGPYMDSSDGRLKINVQPLESRDVLESILKLRAVTFDFDPVTELVLGRTFPAATQLGMIAQEVEEVFPLLVSEGIEGYKSLAYARLSPVLVEGVKALAAENRSLTSKLHYLENKLATLELRISQMMDYFEDGLFLNL